MPAYPLQLCRFGVDDDGRADVVGRREAHATVSGLGRAQRSVEDRDRDRDMFRCEERRSMDQYRHVRTGDEQVGDFGVLLHFRDQAEPAERWANEYKCQRSAGQSDRYPSLPNVKGYEGARTQCPNLRNEFCNPVCRTATA